MLAGRLWWLVALATCAEITLDEAMQAAVSEQKALAEREQVLLHRLSLRERLGNVDWTRASSHEVMSEIRASASAARDPGSPPMTIDDSFTPAKTASTLTTPVATPAR